MNKNLTPQVQVLLLLILCAYLSNRSLPYLFGCGVVLR
jgi:hypothetical protein